MNAEAMVEVPPNPFAVTSTVPDGRAGVTTTSEVSVLDVITAAVPPNVTAVTSERFSPVNSTDCRPEVDPVATEIVTKFGAET